MESTPNGYALPIFPPINSKWFPKTPNTSVPLECVEVVGPAEKQGQPAVRISRGEHRNQTSYFLKTFFDTFEPYDAVKHTDTPKPVREGVQVNGEALTLLYDLVAYYENLATEATGIPATLRVEDVLLRMMILGASVARAQGGVQ